MTFVSETFEEQIAEIIPTGLILRTKSWAQNAECCMILLPSHSRKGSTPGRGTNEWLPGAVRGAQEWSSGDHGPGLLIVLLVT